MKITHKKIKVAIKKIKQDPCYFFEIICILFPLKLMPDDMYLKWRYRACMGKKLDLNNPQSFNEKLQWLKLHDRNPLYTTMVDKHAAKEYVTNIIGKEHIIPTLGVWDRVEDVDFDKLPNQFVLKCTHDCGGLVICRDKNTFDMESARKKLKKHLKREYFFYGREWPYKNVKPRIIAEKYMQNGNEQFMRDYKFYCFGGIPRFLYISEGLENHSTARISFLNLDWTRASFGRTDYKEYDTLPDKPEQFDEMVNVAKRLSAGIPFVRVDLYIVNEKIYFSELTFSPCGGCMHFKPEDWDCKLGEWIELPS